ncbi:MAG: GNAT family N-acetyltransferase [Pseudomonadota bacterium]
MIAIYPDTRLAERILDRPVWAALSTRQAHLCDKTGRACAFNRSVAQFAATDPQAGPEVGDLARVATGRPEGLVLMQADRVRGGRGLEVVETLAGVQMVATGRFHSAEHPGIAALCPGDIPAILSLVALTKPGPFKRRTLETGRYYGIKANGHLIAVAGERMKLPGHTEISAVCTHPSFRGRGLAGKLTQHVAQKIIERGETPFLHTYASNTYAIALYESLGFELRQNMHIIRLVANP